MMTTRGSDPERILGVNRRWHSHGAGTQTRKKETRAFSDGEDALGTHPDYILSEEHPAEEDRAMRAERVVTVSQAASSVAIAGIRGLVEAGVTALVTTNDNSRVIGKNKRLPTMLQVLVTRHSTRN